MKTAFITGITGQDGSYLAELLLSKGYTVHGLVRRASTPNTQRIDHIADRLTLHWGDVLDEASLIRALAASMPDEVYNLAAQSHVKVSFDVPVYTADAAALGVLRLLEAVRHVCPSSRVYQAASSEMFGAAPPPQSETTPFMPQSPYAAAKVFAYHVARNYRDAYGMFICNGILFNHESPRRPDTFVTRKITKAAARILWEKQNELLLGNLEARRDWGFAGDYVQAMWLMLQQDKPDDFVIATGKDYSVREFLDEAFGLCSLDWKKYVRQRPDLYRPTEVDHLRGDASKARRVLGWVPETGFRLLVRAMMEEDVKAEAVGTKGDGLSWPQLNTLANLT